MESKQLDDTSAHPGKCDFSKEKHDDYIRYVGVLIIVQYTCVGICVSVLTFSPCPIYAYV